MESVLNSYLTEFTLATDLINDTAFNEVLLEISSTISNRNTIFVVGNGISAVTADHFVNDLNKSAGKTLNELIGFGIKAVALSGLPSLLTAVANDVAFDEIYAYTLRSAGSGGDLLILFSAGEPHQSLLRAAQFAYTRGMKVVSITGGQASELEKFSSTTYTVPSDSLNITNDIHLLLCHCWTRELRGSIKLPVVFLDRDGVINCEKVNYVKSWDEFEFKPGVIESIKRLNEVGFSVVVVTNQSPVGRNIMSNAALEEIHERMCNELSQKGALISRVFYCPHVPEDNCLCRKPKTGLFNQAYLELPIDPNRSYFIGDSKTDIMAGKHAGITTILLSTSKSVTSEPPLYPDFTSNNLLTCVNWIIGHRTLLDARNLDVNTDNYQNTFEA